MEDFFWKKKVHGGQTFFGKELIERSFWMGGFAAQKNEVFY